MISQGFGPLERITGPIVVSSHSRKDLILALKMYHRTFIGVPVGNLQTAWSWDSNKCLQLVLGTHYTLLAGPR